MCENHIGNQNSHNFCYCRLPSFVTATLVLFSLAQLQQVVRVNLLQSVEFNLHMVSELIHRDIEYLDRLRLSAINHPQTMRFLLEEHENPRLIRDLHTRLNEDMMQNPVAYLEIFLNRPHRHGRA